MLRSALPHSRWHYEMSKPCYPKLFALRSHLLKPSGLVLSLVVGFFSESPTWARVCFTSNRHSFGYCVSISSLICRSRGKCLVISSFYHTNILFTVSPLSYIIMYMFWLSTSYSCFPFTVLVWSYHWRSKYPFSSMPLQEWMYGSP
jgi:hypothetical protein